MKNNAKSVNQETDDTSSIEWKVYSVSIQHVRDRQDACQKIADKLQEITREKYLLKEILTLMDHKGPFLGIVAYKLRT